MACSSWGDSYAHRLILLQLAVTLGREREQNQMEIAKTLKCYSCIDQGDDGCSTEKAEIVPCLAEHDVCVEGVFGAMTSHEQSSAVIKGCGLGGPGKVDKAKSFHGMTFYIQVSQCNTSLCNTRINLDKFALTPPENSTMVPNGIGCYGCIGESAQDNCLPSTAPEVSCYSGYTSCFDGNATMTVGNSTVTLPIKSCSKRSVCAKETLKLGGATFTVKGACCTGHLCNQDLSNSTQHESFPLLEMFHNVVVATTPATALGENSTNNNVTLVNSTHNAVYISSSPIKVTSAMDDNAIIETKKLDKIPIKGKKGSELPTNSHNPTCMANWALWTVLFLAAFCL